jgi:hypothetical protein
LSKRTRKRLLLVQRESSPSPIIKNQENLAYELFEHFVYTGVHPIEA